VKKFDEMYLRESIVLKIVCRNRLNKISPDKYNDFEKPISELKNADA
jgi:hypothetical protein